MKIVRTGGSVTLPKGKHSMAIYEAMLAGDWTPEQLTEDGKPRVDAIEAVLGFDITERQRDEVYAVVSGIPLTEPKPKAKAKAKAKAESKSEVSDNESTDES